MAQSRTYLAIDLGAESGRAILGAFDGERVTLSEVHRFSNGPVRVLDGLHWDVLRLWSEIKDGLSRAAHCDQPPVSIGLDTWGVDFALLDRNGVLLSNPYHYRDSRTDGMVDQAFKRLPREEIFDWTGIQFMQLNTLYQLLSMVTANSPVLDLADRFLTIPDLFNYWLTGQQACEFSIATTTQCYDPRRRDWALPLLAAMSIPHHIFPRVVASGTLLGPLHSTVAEETRASHVQVIAPACHDTGSAVAAVPAEGERFAWISSGTWSIMGTNVPEPIINAASLAYNFTNEGGVGGLYRFSKNIQALWLVQESRRTWATNGQSFTYAELTEMATQAEPFTAIIDPDHTDFLKPGDMPERIRAYCQRTGQRVPDSHGAIVRCALESLALKYRWVLEKIEEMIGYRLEPIHIIGGGTQNRLLNQFAADATGRSVVAGPIEATALGNILMQAVALGDIGSLSDARAIVRQSFTPNMFEPTSSTGWDEAYQRLLSLLSWEYQNA
jgi:rhamnulokinase